MFGLNADNAVGLDLVVHSPEYREEQQLNGEVEWTEKMRKKRKEEQRVLIDADAHVTELYEHKRMIGMLSSSLEKKNL